jgi:hypothetical protein
LTFGSIIGAFYTPFWAAYDSTSTIFFIQQKYLFKNSRGAVRSFGATVSTWMKISKN